MQLLSGNLFRKKMAGWELLVIFLIIVFSFSCSSTPLPRGGSVTVPEDFFGIVHAGETRTPEEYQLLNEMGVTWVLRTFYWNTVENEQGKFDFAGYDDYVGTAIREGKKVLAVLGYEADWLYPPGKSKKYISPENIPLFLNYVEETVRHFGGRVDAWEIWNEPNLMFWKGKDKEFFELTRLAAERIRETDPDAYILGGIFWRTPKSFIKKMHKAGAMENLDGLAFHPYAVNPRGSMKVHDKFLDVLSQINYTGPVWITEMGYPTAGWYPTKASPEEFPAYIVKTMTGSAARGARVLLWYELFDSYNKDEVPPKTRDSEKFFGLLYPNYERKDGAWAYELCARFLPGSRLANDILQRENIPSNVISFCFMDGAAGNNTLILWNDKNRIQNAVLSLASPALLHDASTGQSQSLAAEASLEIGNMPLIITWEGTAAPRLVIDK